MVSLADRLGNGLGIPATSHIVPLVVGSETNTMAFGNSLLHDGYHVGTIRPPTVPPGTSR